MGRIKTLGMSFSDLYVGIRGDLIYGRSNKRDEYRNYYWEQTGNQIEQDSWWSIDQYNNTLGIAFPMQNVGQLDEFINYDRLHPTTFPDRVFHGDFLRRIVDTPRRDPRRIFDVSREDMISREGIVETELMDQQQRYASAVSWKSIRRACKFGIEYVVAKHTRFGSVIHFILDGLEDQDILTKRKLLNTETGRNAVPITTSELRNVYRKWHLAEFNDAIYFYRNYIHVEAPWETNPGSWDKYAETRLLKYKTELDLLIKAGQYRPYRMEAQIWIDAAARAERQGFKGAAVDALRDAKDILEARRATPVGEIAGASSETLIAHAQRAINVYNQRGFFSRQGTKTKEALPFLQQFIKRRQSDLLLKAIHWYLDIEPSAQIVQGIRLSDRLSLNGRLPGILEKEYLHWRFNIRG